jgi:predicted secreted Zn-dependent protease
MALTPSRSFVLAAVSLPAAAFAAQPAPDGLDVRFVKEYYAVPGREWPEIWRSIERMRMPVGSKGERFEGITSYEADLQPKRHCSSRDVTLRATLKVKVPGLDPSTNLDGRSKECWARYERWLTDHEELHVRIAVVSLQKLVDKLREADTASCGDLNAIARKGINEMHAAQNSYDDVTDHGLQQWRAYELVANPDRDDAALAERCARLAEQG